eukprot:gene2122-18167_t
MAFSMMKNSVVRKPVCELARPRRNHNYLDTVTGPARFGLQAPGMRPAARPAARSTVVVKAANVDRRGVLSLLAGTGAALVMPKEAQAIMIGRRCLGDAQGDPVAGAALVMPKEAQAIKIPAQESYGGMGKGGGSMPKSSTRASMEGYSMEGYTGTKKPSYLSASEKKELRAAARENANKLSGKK